MCEVCAVFGVSQHWTDAADLVGTKSVASGILENRSERVKRLKLVNKIVASAGIYVSDWDGEAYGVEDSQGRRKVAQDLSSLWRVVEQMGAVCIDPLEDSFLNQVMQ